MHRKKGRTGRPFFRALELKLVVLRLVAVLEDIGVLNLTGLHLLPPLGGLEGHGAPGFGGLGLLHVSGGVAPVVDAADVLLILLGGVLVAQIPGGDAQQGAVLLADGVQLQILHQQLLQRPLGQVGHDGAVLIGHRLPHAGDLPGAGHDLILGHHLADHAPVQHLLGGPLACGHHVVVAPLGAEVVLGHQAHAVAGHQAAVGVGHLHPGILGADGDVAEHGGVPVEAGAGDGADGGHVQVKYHVLDEVGVVKILVLEPLGGQLGVSLPAVGVKLYELEMQKKNAEKQAMEDNKSDIGWGSQIRSYVLDDSRIKDLRTGVETRNTQAVLDGSLDQFIEASLKAGL